MREYRIDINSAVAASQGVADFHVAISPAAGRPGGKLGLAARHAFDGDLAALAAVFRRVNRHGVRQAADRRRRGRVLLPISRLPLIVTHRIDAPEKEGIHGRVALVDNGLDDAVIQRPGASIVRDGDTGVDRGLGDRRRVVLSLQI